MFWKYKKEILLTAIGVISIAVAAIPSQLLAHGNSTLTKQHLTCNESLTLALVTIPPHMWGTAQADALQNITYKAAAAEVAGGIIVSGISSAINAARAGKAATSAKALEPTTTLYHGGKLRGGSVQPAPLSTTTKLEHALKYAAQQHGGKVYEFQVPTRELTRWTDQMQVQEFRDILHGTSGTGLELRFSPSVAPELNKYHLQIQ